MNKLEKPMNIKEQCRLLGFNYANVVSYKSDHPELSYEQIFEYYLHKDKEPLTKKCERLGVNYEQVRGFKKTHKELSIEQVLELFLSGKNKEYVKQKVLQRNKEKRTNIIEVEKAYRAKSNIVVNGKEFKRLYDMLMYYGISDKCESIRAYLRHHPEKTYEEVLVMYGATEPEDKAEVTKLKQLSKEKGIHFGRAHKYMRYHKLNADDTVEELEKTHILNEYCKKHNIDRKIAHQIRKEHKDATIEEILSLLENREIKHRPQNIDTFKHKCLEIGLEYNTVKGYRRLHPELTDEQVLDYYIQKYSIKSTKNKKLGFKDKCNKLNINYHAACDYRRKHPELTDEQVIMHYRPDCYINWLGELAIPD